MTLDIPLPRGAGVITAPAAAVPSLPERTRAWLAQPALHRLFSAVRDRLERNGLLVRGQLRLADPTVEERDMISLLLGRPCTYGEVLISLAELDARLRGSAAGCGLIDLLTTLVGPLTNRPAARDARRVGWEQVWCSAQHAVEKSGLARLTWAPGWLADLRRAGTLAKVTPERAVELLGQAVQVLTRLFGERSRPAVVGRGDLAERATGSAHGLDESTLLSRIVLRGVASAVGQEVPKTRAQRRELWYAAGVLLDGVSNTVLTYGLAPVEGGWRERALRERAQHHAETHLTARELRQLRWVLPVGMVVHVCENPRVIEAAADAACTRPLVCTSGNPTSTVVSLLDALTAAGAQLCYRGDFDWSGVAIANRIVRRYSARPWRMSAADYEQHVAAAQARGTPLRPSIGEPVDAVWDPDLRPAMCALGVQVHEEAALELLLSDLV